MKLRNIQKWKIFQGPPSKKVKEGAENDAP